MIKIPISIGSADWEIRSEEKQWTLGRLRITETGKTKGEEAFIPEGFYSNLHGVIHGALEQKLRHSDATTLTDLQIELKRAVEELKGLYETEIHEA